MNIEDEFLFDINTDIYLVREYHKKVYGRTYIDAKGNVTYNTFKEIIRDKLWKSLLWRKLVNSKFWLLLKKVLKK